MSTPINLINPLELNGQQIYPPTTSHQVIMPDGRRLDAVLEEEYELVASVTTTEEVDSVHISQDNKGNAYKLKKAIFEVITPASSNYIAVVFYINWLYALYASNGIEPRRKRTVLFAEIQDNKILGTHHYSSPIGTAGRDEGNTYLYYPAIYSSEDSNINYFHIYGVNGGLFPVGTVVNIYGVRK